MAAPVVELPCGIGGGKVLVAAYGIDAVLLGELGGENVEQLLLVGDHNEAMPVLRELSAVFKTHARGGSSDE